MKNITNIEKKQKNHSKDNSKNNNNCLAVFFGIIHFDDMLNSPRIRTTGKKAGLVCGGESLFFHRG